MSGSSGIGRGRSRGLLMQKFLNKDVPVPSVESLEDKALNKLGIPPPGSTTEKTTESSSISSGDSSSKLKLQDSDIENKNITIVKRPLSCIGRGRGLSNPSSLATSSGQSDKIAEIDETNQVKKVIGRGRGLLSSQKECSNSTPSEISNELKDLKLSNDDKMTVSSVEDKSQFENSEKPTTSKFRRREHPTQIKEACNTRNDQSPSIILSANYVKVYTTQPHIYQYHVSFAPTIDSRLMRIKIVQGLSEDQLGVVKEARAFDGMNLYIPQQLKNKETVIKVNKPTDNTSVDVKIVFTNNVNFSECPMVYNVLFKRIENSLRMVKIGRDYFYPEKKIVLDRRRMEIWPGYVTSIQNFDGGLLLQCDVSHKVIRNDSVYDIMMEINKSVNNKGQMQTAAINQLLGQIVLTPHNNRNYRITDIDWTKNCLSEFDKSGEKISYRDYFKNTYGLQIRDLEQPLIVSKSNSRGPKGRKGSKDADGGLVYLIPELCMLTGLTDDMIKDFRLMRELHEHCRVTPKKRHEALLEFVDNIYNCEEANKLLGYWGITIEKDTVNIKACKMNPEMIYFGNEASVSAGENAEFKQALAHNRVISGIRIENWVLVAPKSLMTKANGLLQALMSKSPKIGVNFSKPRIIEMNNDRTEEYIKELKRNVTSSVQLVVTILSAVREDRYNAIKKHCYVDCPVPSQVVLAQTLKEGPKLNSVAVNIALQINAKLGGELWAVKIPIKKFMVVGLDVWHDAKGRGRSVGAVVGSTNALCTRWFSKSHLQEHDKEIVYVLQSCMLSLLKAYFEENNFLPDTIFMYRDGVSDGQLGYVQKTEIEQFFKVFESFSADYKPNMVYNVVQKRINTRLYVSDPKNKGQVNNPNPGTIVDHTVTRANLYDFFLVSQSVRQGTVTPTHYVVLCDNSRYTPHQVQLMAYKTCHIYYNWPGTVRVPAPCMYAHKLAYMVGQNLKAEPSHLLCDRLFYL
uniref:DjPiwiC n=1 Tax=Dugesia japonica TaxID=6161 RepID=D2Z0E0_DUGJA|nr:DjPiwiC [Dugesia japonica]